MITGNYYIITSHREDDEEIMQVHPGGDTKIAAKRELKSLRESMSQTTRAKAWIVRMVGSYSNYMDRSRACDTMTGLAMPDGTEMKVH